ncbi:MAG: tRNA isopentenyl-2-thiomethyl-A-37 hydroxylase MiaE [Sumerlaeia bacterium]
MISTQIDLPLLHATPAEWGARVLEQPLEILNDHAHLEKKAATNALELLLRWPQNHPPETWVQSMTSIANDEVEHLQTVTALLARRGGELKRTHTNAYAAALRKNVRVGRGNEELVDRLLVSALIEARSCERFYLLSQTAVKDIELTKLYASLYASEAGHFRVFLSHAKTLRPAQAVDERWSEFLQIEATLIQTQPFSYTMHSYLS